ncbi:MAG: alpha-hydroxy acid oxidase [Acidimicrobiales bacterium]
MDLGAIETTACIRMERGAYDYIAGGAFDEITLAANVADWAKVRLRPRVLRAVGTVDTATTLLGTPVASPIGVAPTAFHRLAHPEGEEATAAGAAAAGAIYVLPTRSTTSVDDVASSLSGAPFWYQVYVLTDRGFTGELVDRAVAAGASALVLAGDTPVLVRRLRDLVNAFELPSNLGAVESFDRPGNLADQDPNITFDEIGWLAERSGLPVVVKGVLRADDAAQCVQAGARAVWVSNHGGRQLDGAISTAEALPEVCEAVVADCEVYVDGGIRRGTDVLKALAMGARAAFLGRPVIWGLATGGAEGVREVLRGLCDELELAMQLAGAASLDEVTGDLLRVGPPRGEGRGG